MNVCASAPVPASSTVPSSSVEAPAAGDFGDQLLQLLLAGEAPGAIAEADEKLGAADQLVAATEPEDDAVATVLLPGLSLLIQQMMKLDAQTDVVADASVAPAAIGDGPAPGLAGLLDSLAASTSANDDAGQPLIAAMSDPVIDPSTPSLPAAAPPATHATAAPTPSAPLAAAHPERLAEALDERITWLADAARKDGPQQATISLHPAEWGSLQIRVDLAPDGCATVKFDCETPQARQAIESSLTQLRELLSTTVVTGAAPRFELSGGFGHSQSGSAKPRTQASTIDDGDAVESLALAPVRRPLGLLDQFA